MKTSNTKLIKIFRSLSENIPCSDCPMGLSCPSDGCIFEDAADAIDELTRNISDGAFVFDEHLIDELKDSAQSIEMDGWNHPETKLMRKAAEAIQALTHENLFLKSVQSKLVGYVTQNELSEIISEVMKSENVQTIQ